MVKKYLAALLPAFLMFWSMALSAADISVRADRNPVALNESFNLIYETTGSVDDDPDFSPLKNYLDVLNQSSNSNISIINGNYSSKKSWRLTVMAREVGKITLPPIKFGSDQSPAYSLTVNQAAQTSQQQSEFFTRLKAEPRQVYVQQQLVVTQQLFTAQNLSAYGMGELELSSQNVVIEALGEERQYQTRIKDKTYLVVERSFAIYPQTSGSLTLSPVLVEAQLKSGSSSFFGSFGNRGKVLRARSNALEIDVLPLPAQANMNPWLPASDLQLVENWPDKTIRFVQGEPITRTLSLKAEGLTAAQLPEMPAFNIDGLKQYPDQPMLNDVKNDNGITGYRVQKVALIPTRSGQMVLPAIHIPWWNTNTNQREVATVPARRIDVAPATDSADATQITAPPTAAAIKEPEPKNDPAPVAERPPATSDLNSGVWQMLAIMFAVGWVLTLLLWFMKTRPARPSALPVTATNDSISESYKKLMQACKAEDARLCRISLLQWAQALYPHKGIVQLGDCRQWFPAPLNAEVRKIDAMLYGGEQQQINFSLIRDQAKQLMSLRKKSTTPSDEMLEPLYR